MICTAHTVYKCRWLHGVVAVVVPLEELLLWQFVWWAHCQLPTSYQLEPGHLLGALMWLVLLYIVSPSSQR